MKSAYLLLERLKQSNCRGKSMATGKGKSMFSVVEKTYLFKAGLRHIAERPLVIVGQIGTGTGALSMAIAGQIRSTVITVNSLSTFVKDGGTDQDIIEPMQKMVE